MEDNDDEEMSRQGEADDMTELYGSHEHTKMRDEDKPSPWRTLVVSHGKTGQTEELVLFDVAVAHLVKCNLEDSFER